MSYQVGTVCYSTSQQALQAIASANVGSFVVNNGTAFTVDVVSVSNSGIFYKLRSVATGEIVKLDQSFSPQPCGLLDWQDGLLLGWLIAAAWISTAAVMHIRKAIHQ